MKRRLVHNRDDSRSLVNARVIRAAGTFVFLAAGLLPIGGGAMRFPSPARDKDAPQQERRRTSKSHIRTNPPEPEIITAEEIQNAMAVVCSDRKRDPLGSTPIDEMQSKPSLPLNHPTAVEGTRRAERLLPIAKRLTIEALKTLGNDFDIGPAVVTAAAVRVNNVRTVKPDMDQRDNAAVNMSDPRTIRFGTIFLAGLRSDEGMISVLSHELTHFADGKQNALALLFRRVGLRAAKVSGMRLTGQRPEELTSDWIGILVSRSYIAESPSSVDVSRRLARSTQHNCVDRDETDDDHLSPRNTMRALFALDPEFARAILAEKGSQSRIDGRLRYFDLLASQKLSSYYRPR